MSGGGQGRGRAFDRVVGKEFLQLMHLRTEFRLAGSVVWLVLGSKSGRLVLGHGHD